MPTLCHQRGTWRLFLLCARGLQKPAYPLGTQAALPCHHSWRQPKGSAATQWSLRTYCTGLGYCVSPSVNGLLLTAGRAGSLPALLH
ncbi:hypothetical protein OM416_31235 [Paenibacillus sp. LS1]|uniref:hypothetical protein n=1 Tax=Paenibacillus sp. LS1 TaxID=2992120 RepID=UPI00222E8CF5|nr:hypothetical protein [Paenibacillus sp. LS1]MCW3796068.1 hypothetical protein [Paenibacillus sp. LS1]